MEGSLFKTILEIFVVIATIVHAIGYGVKYGKEIWHWTTVALRNSKAVPGKAVSPRDMFLGVVYSLVCAVLWSASYVSLSYVTIQKVDLLTINVYLLGSAAVFLFAGYLICKVVDYFRSTTIRTHVDWGTSIPWITAAANLANFVLFIYALYFVSASQTITLSKINPIFVVFLTWMWLQQKPPKTAFSAVILVVLGSLLITMNEHVSVESNAETLGSLLAVLAGLAFAIFSAGLEKIESVEHRLGSRLLFMAAVFFVSYVGIVSVAYFAHRTPVVDTSAAEILIGNGIRVAVVYAVYHAAVRRVGALLVSVIVALEVPFTMFWDTRLLHRPPVRNLTFGAAAIILGALTLAWDKVRSQPSPAPAP